MNITGHAIDKFKTRAGLNLQPSECKQRISQIVTGGRELVPKIRALMMRHGYRDSRYFTNGTGLIAVVVDRDVVTVLPPNARHEYKEMG